MTLQHTFFATFQNALSFADREKTLIQQIQKESSKLEALGFKILNHQINTRSDSKASVTIIYEK